MFLKTFKELYIVFPGGLVFIFKNSLLVSNISTPIDVVGQVELKLGTYGSLSGKLTFPPQPFPFHIACLTQPVI